MLTSTLSEQTTWHSPDGNQNTSATIWGLLTALIMFLTENQLLFSIITIECQLAIVDPV